MTKKLFFCFLITLLCITSNIAQSKRKKQSLTVKPKTGIRSVDFRNFLYQREAKSNSNGGLSIEAETITLRNGKNKIKGEYTSGEYGNELESVKYIDFDSDGNEEAVVVVSTTQEVAGAYWEQDYFVFAYSKNKPIQIFHEYRYKPSGIRISGKSLIIEAPFWKEDDGHCCPSSIEITTYGWRESGIVEISRKYNSISQETTPQTDASRISLANKSWQAFWKKFSNAIYKKDTKTLIQLSSADADFFDGGGGGTAKDWFKMMSSEWNLVKKAVLSGVEPIRAYDWYGEERIERTTQKHISMIFLFEKDNRWRFFGVTGD